MAIASCSAKRAAVRRMAALGLSVVLPRSHTQVVAELSSSVYKHCSGGAMTIKMGEENVVQELWGACRVHTRLIAVIGVNAGETALRIPALIIVVWR